MKNSISNIESRKPSKSDLIAMPKLEFIEPQPQPKPKHGGQSSHNIRLQPATAKATATNDG